MARWGNRYFPGLRNAGDLLFGGGLSARSLSLTLCLGVAVGVMPLLWGTTVICMALAARLRLNQPAILAVNYLCYPLQLALLLPFNRLGETLMPWGPAVSTEVLLDAFHGGFGGTANLVAWATGRALGAWALTAVPLALSIYPVLNSQLKRCRAEMGRAPLAPRK